MNSNTIVEGRDLLEFFQTVIEPSLGSASRCKRFRIALTYLTRFLGRKPKVSDLTSPNVRGTLASMFKRGLSLQNNGGARRSTVAEHRRSLLAIAKQAHEHKLLSEEPTIPWDSLGESWEQSPSQPGVWTRAEINKLFGSARTIAGDVAGIPSSHWWLALLLTLLNTKVRMRSLLKVPQSSYDARSGEVTVGKRRYRLHPLAVEAINRILPHDHQRLFPWPHDKNDRRHQTLVRRFRKLIFRANIMEPITHPFERLRITGCKSGDILNRLSLSLPFMKRPAKRARRVPRQNDRSSVVTNPELVRITIDSPRNLLRFLEEAYVPQRMADSSPSTVTQYRKTLDQFGWFLGSDPTFDNLDKDTVERYLSWLKQSLGHANRTVNRYRAELLAIWRHAWRKRKVDELPREINKLLESKRVRDPRQLVAEHSPSELIARPIMSRPAVHDGVEFV